MAEQYPIPPTYAPPFIRKPDAKSDAETTINPIWLNWFLDLARTVAPTSFEHNNLGGLQGGSAGEYYHFDQADYTSLLAIISGGGAGASVQEAEIDLGSTFARSGSTTLTDANIVPTSEILLTLAPGPYTGKPGGADEFELVGPIIFGAVPGTGSATIYWTSEFPQRGNVKVKYIRS